MIEALLAECESWEAAAADLKGGRDENESCADEVADGIADAYLDAARAVRGIIGAKR